MTSRRKLPAQFDGSSDSIQLEETLANEIIDTQFNEEEIKEVKNEEPKKKIAKKMESKKSPPQKKNKKATLPVVGAPPKKARVEKRVKQIAREAAEKEAARAAAKAAKPSKYIKVDKSLKPPGVIATIIEVISRETGASFVEIMGVLLDRFPSRTEATMTGTIRIQAPRNATFVEKDAKRGGKVYYKKAK